MKSKFLFVSFGILAAILIYLLNFNLIAFNENHYFNHFEENNIYEKNSQADQILINLLAYYKNKDNLNESYYTENEASHLVDVKKIIKTTRIIFLISLLLEIIVIGLIFYNTENKYKIFTYLLLYSGSTTIFLTILLFLASLNFTSFFLNFHLAFFPQGNFIFPADSVLITLFPEYFFNNTLRLIVVRSIFVAVFLTVVGLILFVTSKKKIYHNKV